MQQIKGSVLKSRLAFVEEHGGKDAVARVLEHLAPDARKQLGMILTVKWYPFDVGRQLDDAIVRVLGDGDSGFFERLGEASARANLATLHRGFLTDGDPHAFLGKAQSIYALYYETGRREYERVSEREGVLTTFDAETFSAPDCLTVIGWYKHALRLCGAAEPRIVEEECRSRGAQTCRYRISWGRG